MFEEPTEYNFRVTSKEAEMWAFLIKQEIREMIWLEQKGESMRILGINCMNHDASMSVVDYSSGIGEILWAAHRNVIQK